MTTRAEFNNNPGNIRPAKGVKYEGLLGVDDKGFGIFESPEMGRKALEDDIRYKLKNGYNTPDSFIDRYTPKGDENGEHGRTNYKAYLMDQTGLQTSGDKFNEKDVAKIANAISAFEHGGWKFGEAAPTPDYAKPLKVEETQEETSKPGETVSSTGKVQSTQTPVDRAGLSIMGGVGGVGVGTTGLAAEKGFELASRLKNRLTGGQPVSAAMELAEKALAQSELPPAQGPAAAKNTGTYNYGKAFGLTNTEAARAVDMSKGPGGAWDLVRQMNEANAKIGPGYTSIPERSDILLDTSAGSGPRGQTKTYVPGVTSGPKVGLPTQPFEAPLTKAAQWMGTAASKAAPYFAPAARVGLSGLGGVLGANQLYDAFQSYRAHPGYMPSPREIAKGLSGAGGVVAMAPFGGPQIIGGLAQVPEMGVEFYDWLRRNKRAATPESTQRMMTNVDPMGNPLP